MQREQAREEQGNASRIVDVVETQIGPLFVPL
jgi:hypothetical protein